MSNLVLVAGQLLSVLVIVGGLAAAFWQIGVLAGKLARMRSDPIVRPRDRAGIPGTDLHEPQAPRSERWSNRIGS